MDRTVQFVLLVGYLFFVKGVLAQQTIQGAMVRGDTTSKKMSIIFSADEFGDGAETIIRVLQQENIKASFFFTGRFYRSKEFAASIRRLKLDGHYLGPHSDQHLLYCDWTKRDSLLVTKRQFRRDLRKNYAAIRKSGINKKDAHYFLPPYEWYNNRIAEWTREEGLQLINFTHGTLSNADYTTPDMKNYRSSETILESIKKYEQQRPAGLNGFILLLHFGTDPRRTDKLYRQLPELIKFLKVNRYQPVRIDELLQQYSPQLTGQSSPLQGIIYLNK